MVFQRVFCTLRTTQIKTGLCLTIFQEIFYNIITFSSLPIYYLQKHRKIHAFHNLFLSNYQLIYGSICTHSTHKCTIKEQTVALVALPHVLTKFELHMHIYSLQALSDNLYNVKLPLLRQLLIKRDSFLLNVVGVVVIVCELCHGHLSRPGIAHCHHPVRTTQGQVCRDQGWQTHPSLLQHPICQAPHRPSPLPGTLLSATFFCILVS